MNNFTINQTNYTFTPINYTFIINQSFKYTMSQNKEIAFLMNKVYDIDKQLGGSAEKGIQKF